VITSNANAPHSPEDDHHNNWATLRVKPASRGD
jgi:hypothetical protein